eukprot:m.21487 g.21487  ORF g.21487 m.21487 type:complete len:69 (+) comp6440_c0_seq2:130-336(+)
MYLGVPLSVSCVCVKVCLPLCACVCLSYELSVAHLLFVSALYLCVCARARPCEGGKTAGVCLFPSVHV